jgi:hypothetical protein
MKTTIEKQNELMKAYLKMMYDLMEMMQVDLEREDCIHTCSIPREAMDGFFDIAKTYRQREKCRTEFKGYTEERRKPQ